MRCATFSRLTMPLCLGEAMENPGKAVAGIDLGTTCSLVAWVDRTGRPSTVVNADGDLTTPSIVYFDTDSVLVGKEADRIAEFEPDLVARFVKRDMGKVCYRRTIRDESFPPEVIQALILRKLKADAELKLGAIDRVVITVPAYFDEPRRKATQDAARMAGLEVLDILNEPTAAAISYGFHKGFISLSADRNRRELIMVYDLGGGTFDVSLMEINGHEFRALGTAGKQRLGGVDWSAMIADYVSEKFVEEFGVNPQDDLSSQHKLMQQAEDAKRSLSAREKVAFVFGHEGHRLKLDITRDLFEELTQELLERTIQTVTRLLKEANRSWGDVTRLLLAGGASRMPMVQRTLEAISGLQVDRSLSPDEAVAHGASIYAALLSGSTTERINDIKVRNVNSHDLSVLGVDRKSGRSRRRVMIPKNSTLPAKQTSTFRTLKPGQKSVVVNVIEGGDAHGRKASRIGKCVVSGLPPHLPAQSPVEVTFQYHANGRIQVDAFLPTIGRKAELHIERANWFTDDTFAFWQGRMTEDLKDATVRSERVLPATPEELPEQRTRDELAGLVEAANPISADRPISRDDESHEWGRTLEGESGLQSLSEVMERGQFMADASADESCDGTAFKFSDFSDLTDASDVTFDEVNVSQRSTRSRGGKKKQREKGPEFHRLPFLQNNSPVVDDTLSESSTNLPRPAATEGDSTLHGVVPFPGIVTDDTVDEPVVRDRSSDDSSSEGLSFDRVAEFFARKGAEPEKRSRRKAHARTAKAMIINGVLHAVVLLLLGLIMLPIEMPQNFTIDCSFSADASAVETEEVAMETPVEEPPVDEPPPVEEVAEVEPEELPEVESTVPIPEADTPMEAAADSELVSTVPVEIPPDTEVTVIEESVPMSERAELLTRYGGTAESEAAVLSALKWLALHQHSDGGWSFDHRNANCKGQCSQPGNMPRSRVAATGMAVMTLLGSGNSCYDGPYRRNVEAGLQFIAANARQVPAGADLRGTFEGQKGMYIQAISTICMAQAMHQNAAALQVAGPRARKVGMKTRRQLEVETRQLSNAAQGGVQFLINAQNSQGGWKYEPGSNGGDTSVLGWVVTALVTARDAGVSVPDSVFDGVTQFLDSVQTEDGAFYGYEEPGSKASTTAIGLFCRLHSGWDETHPALARGVDFLRRRAPERNDMYYNYYATQVMRQWGGPSWEKWNSIMREQLVSTQRTSGHRAGSWDVADQYGEAGGRLYMTCLAAMTLEVYYRHVPILDDVQIVYAIPSAVDRIAGAQRETGATRRQ